MKHNTQHTKTFTPKQVDKLYTGNQGEVKRKPSQNWLEEPAEVDSQYRKILVGCVSEMIYFDCTNRFVEIARAFSHNWLLAVSFLSEIHYRNTGMPGRSK